MKPVPVNPHVTDTTCPFCSVGCSIHLQSIGDMLLRSLPDREGVVNRGLLCGKGRFGFGLVEKDDIITRTMIKKNGKFVDANYQEAFAYTSKVIQSMF